VTFDDFILEHVPTGAVLRVRHGGSGKPVTTDDHTPYSKRAMAPAEPPAALLSFLDHSSDGDA
jgi:hypothetical protein